MKLSVEATIAPEKITNYLLQWRPENDKSGFLARTGYDSENWEQLANDLRRQILPREARLTERTRYGDVYEIRGILTGPLGVPLRVVTIWMIEHESQQTKFITLFPDKEY